MSWRSRLTNVFRPGRLDHEIDEEIQFHIDERIRELRASGMSREAAERQTARRFGNSLRLREESRDVKMLAWLDSLGRDIRLGARMLRKHATVTGAAVVSLSLALGASIAAFSLVDGLILRPLPVRHPEQLIYLVFPTHEPDRPESETFNDPLFVRLRESGRDRVDLVAIGTQVMRPATFGDAGDKEEIRTQYLSGDAFEMLGVRPAPGRLIGSADDTRPGDHPVVVLSHAFWMRRFGGDPATVGHWMTLENRRFQIIGVAEARFTGIEPGRPTDLWLPYAMYNPRAFGNAEFNWFRIVGRMKNRSELGEIQNDLQTAFTSFRRERVGSLGPGPDRSPEMVAQFLSTPLYVRSAANGPSPLRRQFERSLWLLASIAVLVLLIAGSNVANLFLARTAARERELSLRLSIGAGRGRLIQQVLIESALVAVVASVLALIFAGIVAPSMVTMLASADDPVHLDLRPDWRVVAFAGALTLLIIALFGLAPALRASSVAPMTALKAGGGRAGIRTGVMRPFVAVQVAFSLVVVFVGGLLVLSFARVSSVNPGFATSDVLLFSLQPAAPMEANHRRAALFDVVDRIRGFSGVQSASASEFSMLGQAWTHFISVPGTAYERIEATMSPVTDGFFETMGIPVVAGRAFVRHDMDLDPSTAVIVNETFARAYFGREPAVGRTFEGRFDDNVRAHEVVGVVADTLYDLRKAAAPTIYIPVTRRTNATVRVRAAGDPAATGLRLREQIRAANASFRVTSVTPQSEAVAQTLLRERLLALLAGFFAAVGLVLTAVGLYGVLSYSVMQRTREIGIRIALGARRTGAIRTVLADAAVTSAIGTVAGLAAGLYLSRFVEALLFEVRPLDFWSLALPLGILLLAAALAAALPAMRAARVNPVIALRDE
jgi:predicted permease